MSKSKKPRKNWTLEELHELANLYTEGISISDLATYFDVTESSISSQLTNLRHSEGFNLPDKRCKLANAYKAEILNNSVESIDQNTEMTLEEKYEDVKVKYEFLRNENLKQKQEIIQLKEVFNECRKELKKYEHLLELMDTRAVDNAKKADIFNNFATLFGIYPDIAQEFVKRMGLS